MPWTDDAACRGKPTEIFFPATDKHGVANTPRGRADEATAKEVCASCPVSDDCRREHLSEQIGIFFGTNPEERRAIRRVSPPPPRVPLVPKQCKNPACAVTFMPVRARQECCNRACGRVVAGAATSTPWQHFMGDAARKGRVSA